MKIWSAITGLFSSAAEEPMREAAGSTIDPDEHKWRRLTGDKKRDLSPVSQDRSFDLAAWLWMTNPIANRLIELPVAYMLAEGVELEVEDEEAQKWINAFWNDPINCMDLKLAKKVRELALYGEQCWPAFTNEINGQVRLGYIDPSDIETVVTDPDNSEQPIGIVMKLDNRHRKRRYRVIVNGTEDVFAETARRIRETFDDGECFYFTVNDLSNQSRGHSDMLPMMDWLDGYDRAMFGELERWDFLRSFIWDVTLTGATPEEVKERAKAIKVPEAGAVRVHNDAEVWKSESPQLGSYEASNSARLFRNHIIGGATIPEHWFGGGGDVNRATAGEMGEPAVKVFTMRQKQIGFILSQVVTYVIHTRLRVLYGATVDQSDRSEDYEVTAKFPELTAKDTTKYAAAFAQVVAGTVTAVDRGLLSEQSAVALIGLVAGQLGLEIDPEEEIERAREEADQRAEDEGVPDLPEDPADDLSDAAATAE